MFIRVHLWLVLLLCALALPLAADPLPGTQPLTLEGDIASQLVDGVDRFLLKQIELAEKNREKYWQRDTSSVEAYGKSIEPNRQRLRHILGMRDPRPEFDALTYTLGTEKQSLVGKGDGFEVYAVRWPAVGHQHRAVGGSKWPIATTIHGVGLLLVPTDREPIADVVAIPHCDQTPEQIVGLAEGVPAEAQYARRLAESGCRVIVPMLINREDFFHGITNREFLYRSAFEVGRHLIGYEVQKVLAAVDWFEREEKIRNPQSAIRNRKIGVIGYGDGGMLALYAGALDTRIDATVVSGYFGNRNEIWKQPLDRNVFGLLKEFGDAEVFAMIAPRSRMIDKTMFPQSTRSGGGGAPLQIGTPDFHLIDKQWNVAASISRFPLSAITDRKENIAPNGNYLLEQLTGHETKLGEASAYSSSSGELQRIESFDPATRHARQFDEIDRHTQTILRDSPSVRQENFWNKLDYSSLEAYEKSIEPFSKQFREEVIGHFDIPLLAANPRSRLVEENDKWRRYEVVLDVFEDVIAYGLLTLPKDIQPGERRPVVVCQHGLEGRPQSVIGEEGHYAYKAYATKLAERGFITFAPQNLYIFTDRFRSLQRKANPLGKTLFSIIVPQHQQIVNWLKTQSWVDPDRIAFYGLSYGGKSAMRIPPLVPDYCLSICSADFNEWVDKNASTHNPHSYAYTGEYEIFEWDLGSTFNYAEMAALIAPRPFMVERGHFDGVASDETVAAEYAKVRFLYAAKLKIPDRTEIEWFDGPHTINGKGTFDFLHKHLNWPKPGE